MQDDAAGERHEEDLGRRSAQDDAAGERREEDLGRRSAQDDAAGERHEERHSRLFRSLYAFKALYVFSIQP